jgi:alpha-1,6-mannosyltransferase
MRVPALLAVVVVAAFVPVIAGRAGGDPAMATWLVVANPILLVTLVGGAHNDALMLAFLGGALVAGQRRRWVVGGVLLGLACAVKLIALPVLLAMVALGLGDRWRRRELVTASARVGVAALATFSVISAATGLGVGWVQGLRDGKGIGTGPRQLIDWLSGGRPPGAAVTFVLAGAAVVVVTVKVLPRFPVQATAAYLGIVVMAQVNQRSWYWAVPILLVAIVPNPPWVWRLVGAWSAALSVELVLAEYNVPTLEPVSHVVIVAFVLGVAAGVGWWFLSVLLERASRRTSATHGLAVAVD